MPELDLSMNENKGGKRASTSLPPYLAMLRKDFRKNKYLYFIGLFGVAYYFIFSYIPMYGIIIAFKDYSPVKGIMGSPWVGFQHFTEFFQSFYFWRLLRNTLLINLYELLFAFPAPIILALLLNEVKHAFFKRSVQTVTYLPHFVSIVVICGMIVDFSRKGGLFNLILGWFGLEAQNLLLDPSLFRTIFIGSGIWQGIGWGSIIYLAALTSIDSQLYDAAKIDGANRWKQMLHVTLPGIMPTIIILLILRIGGMMDVGFEKIILLYNSQTYETADVISSFVYRRGLLEADYSYSTAVSLFNSVVNFMLLILANRISRKVNETSLW
ncbi:putative aldouronate transport system permease protein [Paenibacillus phyllosphaerae]|uniref:Putative aldouronate transport system permease protein n=2 Tax=Paenibacillus phyllosphaerae TaxID=274593 RepID=A0A7W5FQD5_9BACL|nr:putative aldouronate transport system permease protein [Paenibacillus phyllosphaerae]